MNEGIADITALPYLETIPLPAMLVGGQSRILAANKLAEELNPNAAANHPFVLVFRQPGLAAAVDQCLATQAPQHASYLHHDGPQETRYDVTCTYLNTVQHQGVILCFQDVTHLQQAGQMRREFVANVSHELRTPLTALLGFIETLQGSARNDATARERFLGIMASEAHRMNRLVGDLLSLSRVEEVARMRPTDQIDINALLKGAIKNLTPLAAKSDCRIQFTPTKTTTLLPLDADQMLQVFTNLIENAIKYGNPGTCVTITVTPTERDTILRKPAVQIDVSDDGVGIDAVHIPRLTERFYRIDSHRSREKGGTGLGLAIVKHIVNRHRGRFRINSILGQGSTFSVVLPLE